MKIFFSTDNSVEQNLMQYCPFGEQHNFMLDHENDKSIIMTKCVGCAGCAECPFCYGKGYSGYMSNKGSTILIPNNVNRNSYLYDDGYDDNRQTGLKQFALISDRDYVKCAKAYTDEYRLTSKWLKFRIWWWHHIGINIHNLRWNMERLYYKCKWICKWKLKNFNSRITD